MSLPSLRIFSAQSVDGTLYLCLGQEEKFEFRLLQFRSGIRSLLQRNPDALQAGARGYLIKNIDADYLVRAIRRAAAGESALAEAMTTKLVAQIRPSKSKRAGNPARLH